MVVYQCLLAVDTFGLNVEGIYRVSGSANHVNYMKALFDHGTKLYPFPHLKKSLFLVLTSLLLLLLLPYDHC